jgi:methyl halide transferase
MVREQGVSNVNLPEFWSDAYNEGRAGWDLGSTTPVFEDILRSPEQLPEGSKSFAPGSLLIPCSGHGYDALLYAANGFDVTAVDFAPEPLKVLSDTAEKEGLALSVLERDMFRLSPEYDSSFDYIMEYTCLCAIDIERRQEYIDLMYRLLKPGGWVLGLLFPVEDRPGGPPYGLNVPELNAMLTGKFRILDERDHPATIKPRRGREKFVVWEKMT